VGDVIVTTSVLRALRLENPELHLMFGTRAPMAGLVEGLADEILSLGPDEPLISYIARLRTAAPDAILDLHDSLRSQVIRMFLPEVPATVWEGRSLPERLRVRFGRQKPFAGVRQEKRAIQAAERLFGKIFPETTPSVQIGETTKAALEARLPRTDRPMLGMAPGAGWETKRWPYFGALAARATAGGWQVVVAGGPGEDGLCREVAGACPEAWILPGLPLLELGALWQRCAVVVVNDSGPMHLARAVGAPLVALFGSTDPHQFRWDPASFTHQHPTERVLRRDLPCMPCSFYGRRTCPEGHFRCMKEMEADAVWGEIQSLRP
jgi:heptosyltransferase-2